MKPRLVLLLAALLIAGGCASTPASSPPAPQVASESAAEPESSKILDFEEENGIDTSDWYPRVKDVTIQSGALWVVTDLAENGAAKSVASEMCGAYAQYSLEHPEVSVVYVRAKSGLQLAKCGPGA